MSHTLQTAIVFPVVFAGIVALISLGPILYKESVDAALFHVAAIQKSLENTQIYTVDPLQMDSGSCDVVCTSPERMYSLIRALKDSALILSEGVFSS